MGITRVSDNVYSVGVLNPSLRVFDIVMESKFGTTYNAYLITGDKVTLVDTVHEDYFDEYLYNLQCLTDIQDIEYIIMNHTELDHSGSLVKLLEINPNIKVVCTVAAQKYLKAITNRDFNCITVKNSDTLDIGGEGLEFVVAPLLHWPDSMMTYHKDDKVLFSCDFLGSHFCEPSMFDESIHYKKEYLEQFLYYYKGIFGPFKPYVLSGLDKIENLEIEAVCPSHGPIIVEEIEQRMQDYRLWSTPQKKDKKSVAIIYASAYNCTRRLAERAFSAISESSDFDVQLIDIVTTPIEEVCETIENADALLVGSCTINRDAPKVIWDVLSGIDAINVKSKPAGAFGSYGWSGEAVEMIKTRLSQLKYNFIEDGIKVNFMPTDQDLNLIGEYASRVASKISE